MKPDYNSFSVYATVAAVAGQVGCLLSVVIGGSLILGLVLDQALGTRPLFIFLFLLGSIPLNLFAVYRYIRYKTRRLEQTSSQKEGTIRDDQLER